MPKLSNIIGNRYGKLVVLQRSENTSSGKVTWLCQCDCGNTRIATTTGLLHGETTSCGCVGKGKWTKHNISGNRYGKLTVIEYVGKSRWLCRCDCGNETIATANDLLIGKRVSCGCGKNIKIMTTKYGKLTPIEYDHSENGRAFWKFECDCGNIKAINSHDVRQGKIHSCGCANPSSNGSIAENEIKSYIESITKIDSSKNRLLDFEDGGNNKEIDIYIPFLKLGVEYNGSAFHASKNNIFADKSKLYHKQKFLAAKNQGIHLISIFDVDWDNNQEKIKMYIRSLLTDNEKIFARKCELKVIDKATANEFTDAYHIQGKARMSSINYGLYYNGELLSVMSFGKLRLKVSGKGDYELHRYCVKDGYTIVGGANKLLKAFERDYNPTYLLSFSDNDYFIGDIYDRLGFKNSGQSTPRYYWFLNNNEIKREKCQLKHLKREYPELLQEAYDNNAKNKEDYVMIALGARKVYRSGNTKWEKTY